MATSIVEPSDRTRGEEPPVHACLEKFFQKFAMADRLVKFWLNYKYGLISVLLILL